LQNSDFTFVKLFREGHKKNLHGIKSVKA